MLTGKLLQSFLQCDVLVIVAYARVQLTRSSILRRLSEPQFLPISSPVLETNEAPGTRIEPAHSMSRHGCRASPAVPTVHLVKCRGQLAAY
ncbi:hypothetical protein BV20DRAFT_970912 [Pilatotrama ljubarskyi]|nr:hypothetical protein BV20DRAFT_970912 [Pilatotrama ljubarskyi]